ncbi:MAG: hypothetical protein M1814_003223 [Vezdaea aestivalis]|nr:MAG: hypothetical protein M1814_003223 [Vezdaea aestivalis]
MVSKRKRDSDAETQDDRAINKLRQYFESQFQPLKLLQISQGTSSASDESESEFEGFSDEKDTSGSAPVEVVDYASASQDGGNNLAKAEARSFMLSKPPSSVKTFGTKPSKGRDEGKEDEEDEASEAANLKNDLSLQRLLQESHLLDSSLNLTSANRRRATLSRLQTLGVKKSMLGHAKMPMSHRLGIDRKKAEVEEKRRKEARENGIILERKTKEKEKRAHRDRGVGDPSVGKFKGGTLSLSRRDIAEIERANRSGRDRGRGKGHRR